MRPIHTATLDKSRPVLVLTREIVRPHLSSVTIAPITSKVKGLSTEVPVGTRNGLSQECVVACDHITTIPAHALGEQIGLLLEDQEPTLTEAIQAAFDLD
jgi:mRNA interferase MazF